MHHQTGTSQLVGYTPEHATYPAVWNECIREAYLVHNGEVVVVEVWLVIKSPGRVKAELVHDCLEAVNHIPVHIGAIELKKILYDAVMLKWHIWTTNYPLSLNNLVMHDHNWVTLLPRNPDCNIIATQFFKTGKKGAQTFRAGKCVINLHIPNDIYEGMLTQKSKLEAKNDTASTERCYQLAKTKGKKRMRSLSPDQATSPSLQCHQVSNIHPNKQAKTTKSDRHSIGRSISITPVTQSNVQHIAPTSATSGVNAHQWLSSPSARHISQALKAQRCPTNKEIWPFFKLSIFNILAYPVECWTLDDLVDNQPTSSTGQEQAKTFYLGKNLLSTTLQLDLSTSKVKKGGFKIAAFGTSTTNLFKSSVTQDVCAKRTYHVVERVTEDNGSLVTKFMDVPHDSQKQFQNLSMEITCIVWAQALLNVVYDFITAETVSLGQPPFQIPKFRFVESVLAVEHPSDSDARAGAAGQKTTIFLVEEVIAEDLQGPYRKYLNNISPVPLSMASKEDVDRAKFLAFSQHVQYWKTKKQAFVSDYQGGNSLLSDPQISSAW
ncbi:hypothetical protein APHAL10511_007474 [Amanita phalloides]|nr:hypothetical protein APHAL10511_007474 [Amanita phalloides]